MLKRSVIVLMIFYSAITNSAFRIHISLSLLGMVKRPDRDNTTTQRHPCKAEAFPRLLAFEPTVDLKSSARFRWSAAGNAWITSSYGYGAVTTAILAGYMSDTFGPTKILLYSNGISTTLTILAIGLSYIHWSYVAICRIFIGMMGSMTYPCLQSLIANWAPPKERGKFVSAFSGSYLGIVCTQISVSFLTDTFGWQWGFAIIGANGFVYSLLCYKTIADSPEKSKNISQEEKEYILKHTTGSVMPWKSMPPYKEIFTNGPFIALFLAQVGHMYGLNLIQASAPKYMYGVLDFDLETAGIIAAVPNLCGLFGGFLFGNLGDLLMKHRICSTTRLRKGFIIISHILAGGGFLCLTFAECDRTLSVIFFIVIPICNSASVITSLINGQDIGKNYAGTIYAITTFVGGTSGFVVPLLLSLLVVNEDILTAWKFVFLGGTFVYWTGGISFLIFGSGEEQPFNKTRN